jgi:hypothetical protein
MSKSTLYNFNKTTPEAITDEGYTDCGASAFVLGDVARAFTSENLVIRTAAAGGGDLLVQDVDYELSEEDFYYTEEIGFHIYKEVTILTVGYQTGTLYFSYDCYGSYTDIKTIQDLLTLYTLTDPKFRITMHTPHGFHGDVLWRSATQLQIKPKNKDGQRFTAAILNDGSDGGFLSLTTDRVVDITAAGDEGILDGITRIADAWYRVVAYKGSDEALHFGLSWMPITTFSDNNPTAALTLNTVTPVGGAGTNIGTLFAPGGRLALWNSSAKFETPIYDTTGGYDASRDKPKVKSDRSATALKLVDSLGVANFSTGDYVYQVDGFKPLQVSDGLIASAIGARGYMDTGIRIRTDASGNIRPFVIIGDEFYFCNGSGADNYGWNAGLGTVTVTTSWANYRVLLVPPDKCGIQLHGDNNAITKYVRPYYMAYGEAMYNFSYVWKGESRIQHGILSAWSGAGHTSQTRGYII